MDTPGVFACCPQGNGERMAGYFVGFLGGVMGGAAMAAFWGMLVHLFLSVAPFGLWPYVFYYFTLTLPAVVFYLGLAMWLFASGRRMFGGLVVLLVVLFLNRRYGDGLAWGLLDLLGVYLPNGISGITGHVGTGAYLLQRGCWMAVGVALAGLSVKGCGRLLNWRWR